MHQSQQRIHGNAMRDCDRFGGLAHVGSRTRGGAPGAGSSSGDREPDDCTTSIRVPLRSRNTARRSRSWRPSRVSAASPAPSRRSTSRRSRARRGRTPANGRGRRRRFRRARGGGSPRIRVFAWARSRVIADSHPFRSEAPVAQLRSEEVAVHFEARGEHRAHVAEVLFGAPFAEELQPASSFCSGASRARTRICCGSG